MESLWWVGGFRIWCFRCGCWLWSRFVAIRFYLIGILPDLVSQRVSRVRLRLLDLVAVLLGGGVHVFGFVVDYIFWYGWGVPEDWISSPVKKICGDFLGFWVRLMIEIWVHRLSLPTVRLAWFFGELLGGVDHCLVGAWARVFYRSWRS